MIECPKCSYRWKICSYRWKIYGNAPAVQSTGTEVIEIIETERSEEFFGEDRRVIEVERAKSGGTELSLGPKDAGALRLSSEDKLRLTYSVSADTKETSTEDVSCEAPPYRKLTVILRWRRIWQHGIVVAVRDGEPLHIPFCVAVGVTFDQQQIEEEGSAPTESTSI